MAAKKGPQVVVGKVTKSNRAWAKKKSAWKMQQITAKQRAARKRNIEVARRAKKTSGGGTKKQQVQRSARALRISARKKK